MRSPAVTGTIVADVRRSGYCLSRDEMTDGTSSVAAPIAGPSGDVVAGLSVVVRTVACDGRRCRNERG